MELRKWTDASESYWEFPFSWGITMITFLNSKWIHFLFLSTGCLPCISHSPDFTPVPPVTTRPGLGELKAPSSFWLKAKKATAWASDQSGFQASLDWKLYMSLYSSTSANKAANLEDGKASKWSPLAHTVLAPWKKSYEKPRQCIKNERHHFASKGPHGQSYVFSSSHVQIWELDHKEGWVPKNWCFRIVALEKILESTLDCKEIKPVNPKGI